MGDPTPDEIKTEAEYRAAVDEMNRLFEEDPPPGSVADQRLSRLSQEVARYEDKNYPMRE
jgi:antitoxin component HigA of HigAB toxin-antitoxin module